MITNLNNELISGAHVFNRTSNDFIVKIVGGREVTIEDVPYQVFYLSCTPLSQSEIFLLIGHISPPRGRALAGQNA